MIFIAFDVSSVAESLSRWELGEYISEGFVVVACAGELVADFGRQCLTRAHRNRVERLSTILLVVSLLSSLICLERANVLSGILIGSIRDKAVDAETKARSALEVSDKAQDKADAAGAAAGEAQIKADSVAKQAADLLKKYLASEREVAELKAKVGPRRLSSKQKEVFGKIVAAFTTRGISVSCVSSGGGDGEIADFTKDFVEAFKNPTLGFSVVPQLQCSLISAPGFNPPPVQVEAGPDRQGDADILVKALVGLGINKKNIAITTNGNRALLDLTIGPKAP